MFTLQIALGKIASVRSSSIFDPHLYYEAKSAPINKKLKPTITVFIDVEIVDGVKQVKGFVSLYYCQVRKDDKVLSVGDNLLILQLSICMRICLFLGSFVILEAVLLYRRLNTVLLLHFIITVAILAVVLRVFTPLIGG